MNVAAKIPKPRRGRPSAARASAIDRVIIAIAKERFLADGFDAVTMEQVASQAEVSKGTLYARHPSKEALFSAVIEATVKEWSDEASEADRAPAQDIATRLRHHARTIAASVQRPDVQAMQRLILSTKVKFPQLARAMHDCGYRYIVDLVAHDLVEDASVRGDDLRDPGAVARVLVDALTGFQIQEEPAQDAGARIEDFAERLVDIIVSGRAAW